MPNRPTLEQGYLLAFATLVLPGVLGTLAYRLRIPSDDIKAKDRLIEIVTFSFLNLVLILPIAQLLRTVAEMPNSVSALWGLSILFLVISPVLLGVVVAQGRILIEQTGWSVGCHRTAFDAVFALRDGCWIIVELLGGRMVDGRFGQDSYASNHPNSGDLFIEELWTVSDDGRYFLHKSEGEPGIVVKASEYRLFKVFFD